MLFPTARLEGSGVKPSEHTDRISDFSNQNKVLPNHSKNVTNHNNNVAEKRISHDEDKESDFNSILKKEEENIEKDNDKSEIYSNELFSLLNPYLVNQNNFDENGDKIQINNTEFKDINNVINEDIDVDFLKNKTTIELNPGITNINYQNLNENNDKLNSEFDKITGFFKNNQPISLLKKHENDQNNLLSGIIHKPENIKELLDSTSNYNISKSVADLRSQEEVRLKDDPVIKDLSSSLLFPNKITEKLPIISKEMHTINELEVQNNVQFSDDFKENIVKFILKSENDLNINSPKDSFFKEEAFSKNPRENLNFNLINQKIINESSQIFPPELNSQDDKYKVLKNIISNLSNEFNNLKNEIYSDDLSGEMLKGELKGEFEEVEQISLKSAPIVAENLNSKLERSNSNSTKLAQNSLNLTFAKNNVQEDLPKSKLGVQEDNLKYLEVEKNVAQFISTSNDEPFKKFMDSKKENNKENYFESYSIIGNNGETINRSDFNSNVLAKESQAIPPAITKAIELTDQLKASQGGVAKLQLQDSNLGKISLQIDMRDKGSVNIYIQAEHDDVKKKIEEKVDFLKQSLDVQKINLGEFKVTTVDKSGSSQFSNPDQNSQSQQNFNFLNSQNGDFKHNSQNSDDNPFEENKTSSISNKNYKNMQKNTTTNIQRSANGSIKVLA